MYDNYTKGYRKIIHHDELPVQNQKEDGQNAGKTNRIEDFVHIPYPGMPNNTLVRFCIKKRQDRNNGNNRQLNKEFFTVEIKG
jgi:hypothetical protein